MTREIRRQMIETGKADLQAVVKAAIARAKKGNVRAFAELINRLDGKVPDVTEDATGRPTYEQFLLSLEEAARAERERVQGLGKGEHDAE